MKITYLSASEYYKSIFGQKIYKISLDAGCTCPTRDGTKGTRGCIFCSAAGSGDFASSGKLPIQEQVKQAKSLVINKIPKRQREGAKFVAYFQSFTNTYGNQEALLATFNQAIAEPDIVGIAIATRPDCLNASFIQEIAQLRPPHYPEHQAFHISLELGFQTSKEQSVQFIRRGYENQCYVQAVAAIHRLAPQIHVVTHVIFGLPEETPADMLNTVQFVLASQTDGIKFTVLHILENTDLAPLWKAGQVPTLSQEEYFSLLKQALALVQEYTTKHEKPIVIHRLTGDGPKKILLAPLWTANKKKVLNDLTAFLNEE
ncbi:MAG: TIGR01212 family radical SAM protein [Treponema sp.]|nr:TIGR01212 family radical SAM protein [Treponema sp.]